MAAPFDYSGLLATATDLIASFGRDVVLRVASKTPATPAKPWGAVQDTATASDDVQVTAKAAFLDPELRDEDGRVVRNAIARVLIAATSLGGVALDDTWEVVDGTRVYAVLAAKPVQPGPTLLYYDVTVRT